MSPASKVRVYIACSLDGFIAGAGDDLSWLDHEPQPEDDTDDGCVDFTQFVSGVGALLMGRRTYDVVSGLAEELPYGEIPILVATSQPMVEHGPTVRPVQGTIVELIKEACEVAAGKDVYLDGGNLIRQALDAGKVDDLIITMVPKLLGEGIPLFAGLTQRHSLKFTGHYRYGRMIQIHAHPVL